MVEDKPSKLSCICTPHHHHHYLFPSCLPHLTVQLDLEDPALLEIAEILDSQAGDKYTVMLVRNTEDMDNASFVHIQMLNKDSRESIRYVK